MMKHYIAMWVRPDGLYHSRTLSADEARRWEGRTIRYNNHNYIFTTRYVSRLVGWYPWQSPTFNPFKFFWQWLERRFVSVGFIYYREHPDPLHSQVIPDKPVTFIHHLSPVDKAISPDGFHQIVTQQLYKQYNKKNPWSGKVGTSTILILVAAVVAIVILLTLTGTIHIGGKP